MACEGSSPRCAPNPFIPIPNRDFLPAGRERNQGQAVQCDWDFMLVPEGRMILSTFQRWVQPYEGQHVPKGRLTSVPPQPSLRDS
jgi:hypothetical protein